MKTFKQFISETPQDLGPTSGNLTKSKYNSTIYNSYLNHKKVGDINNMSVMHNKDGKESKYSVLDHENKRVAFQTRFERRPKNKEVPFSHHTQTYVNKHEQSDLGKGFGHKFVYHHLINKHDIPLVSDKEQYTGGHKMWNHLIDHSFKEGHHAYVLDSGKLTKITPENKDNLLSSTYGKDESFRNKRYVISKKEL